MVKIESWEHYCKLARKTESIPKIIYEFLDETGDTSLTPSMQWATRLAHAAAGLVTETQELIDGWNTLGHQNRIEELGDCWWYIPIIQDVTKWNIGKWGTRYTEDDGPLPDLPTIFNNLQTHAAEILNITFKRHIIYGKELELDKLETAARLYILALSDINKYMGYSIYEIWEANIEKLAKRYPDGRFDLEATSNRNVEKELNHIDPKLLEQAYYRLDSPKINIVTPPFQMYSDSKFTIEKIDKESFCRICRELVPPTDLFRVVGHWLTELTNSYSSINALAMAEAMKHGYRELLKPKSGNIKEQAESILEDAWQIFCLYRSIYERSLKGDFVTWLVDTNKIRTI